jgi:hypothetical protein
MPRPKFALALIALVLIALATTAHATWYSESLYVSDGNLTGYFAYYQGVFPVYDSVHWSPGNPIRWGYRIANFTPVRPYPRDNGYCVFNVPHFNAISTPVCTLHYYQSYHNRSANLLVNKWEPLDYWGPGNQSDNSYCFFAIWNSHDTVATDAAHTTDGAWYKVPLTQMACAAILDTSAAHSDGTGKFWTGWVYPGSVDSTYTDARGVDGYDDHPPFIKVYYEWQ